MTEADFEDVLDESFDDGQWSNERIARWLRRAQALTSCRPVLARFREFVASADHQPRLTSSLSLTTFRKLYRLTHGTEQERFAALLKQLSSHEAGGNEAVAKPTFRAEVERILADGQWHAVGKIVASFRQAYPAADDSAARWALEGLRKRPPRGKELVSKRIGPTWQYRLRAAVIPARRVPTELVTTLVEGIAPIVEELKQWGRHGEYEMSPGAIQVLAIRLEKVLDPLRQSTRP